MGYASTRNASRTRVYSGRKAQKRGSPSENENLHDDEDNGDDDTLHTTAEHRVCNDWERLVCDHVGEEQSDEEQMAIGADGLDLFCVLALFTA